MIALLCVIIHQYNEIIKEKEVNFMNQRKLSKITFEVAIIILIAICMIILIIFSNNKLDEVITSDREALLMKHDPDNPIHQDLAEEIIDFRPDACKMIEVYSEKFESLFKVHFKTNHDHKDNLLDYKDLVRLFKNNKEGHTTITVGDEEEDVYFRWTKTANDEMCLVVIYMSRPIVKNLWVFSALCYTILLLIFILLIRILIKYHNDKIRIYQITSQEIRNRILN